MNQTLQTILQPNTSNKKNNSNDIAAKLLKIEKLKKDNEELIQKINSINILFSEKTKDSLEKYCIVKENFILTLINTLLQNKFTSWQKDIIEEMMDEEIDILRQKGYSSEKLDASLNNFYASEINKFNKKDKDLFDKNISDMMGEMGIEFDEEFDVEDLNNPDFQKKILEKFAEKEAQEAANNKHNENQNKEQNKDIDFQKLYKKLVKHIHPDLTKSTEEKALKEMQMKKLTSAWDNREYYVLLELWLEFDPENTIGFETANINKKEIIKNLNEKIRKLEAENYSIKHIKQDTSFLYKTFYNKKESTILQRIEQYEISLNKDCKETIKLELIANDTKKFKKYLSQKQKEIEEEYDLDDFNIMISSLLRR